MTKQFKRFCIKLFCFSLFPAYATAADSLLPENEFTGLLYLSSAGAYQKKPSLTSPYLHQQDLRLMLDGKNDALSYELHTQTIASQSNAAALNFPQPQSTFQINPLKASFFDKQRNSIRYSSLMKIDRLNVKTNFSDFDIRLGRQAISWGVGRFWQPLDIFGAFDANELVRDYKPGIDVLNINYYPNNFSNINLVSVFSKNKQNNVGIHYNLPLNDKIYLSLLVANSQNKKIVGGAIETDWLGAGIRFESTYSPATSTQPYSLFSVAGFDYQFISNNFLNEWILIGEVYYNNRGANQASEFSTIISGNDFQRGLLKHLSRQLAAFALQKNISPLVLIQYMWINAIISKPIIETSSLHQLSAVYSVSNESDVRLTLLSSTGKKSDDYGIPQSEFGHIPLSLSILFRMYF